MSAGLPDFVRRWFPEAEQVGEGTDPAATVAPLLEFNRALAPGEVWQDDDVSVLVVEQQDVWLWGVLDGGRYVERENADGGRWRSIETDAEQFWLHHAAFEALWSSPAMRSAGKLDAVAVGRILGASRPLPCAPWHWPGDRHTLHASDGALVMVCEDRGGFWVVAAGRDESDLAALDALDLVWDEADTRAAPL
jgi:hypothetical protein